jgi:hypothetical protein
LRPGDLTGRPDFIACGALRDSPWSIFMQLAFCATCRKALAVPVPAWPYLEDGVPVLCHECADVMDMDD